MFIIDDVVFFTKYKSKKVARNALKFARRNVNVKHSTYLVISNHFSYVITLSTHAQNHQHYLVVFLNLLIP